MYEGEIDAKKANKHKYQIKVVWPPLYLELYALILRVSTKLLIPI